MGRQQGGEGRGEGELWLEGKMRFLKSELIKK